MAFEVLITCYLMNLARNKQSMCVFGFLGVNGIYTKKVYFDSSFLGVNFLIYKEIVLPLFLRIAM